MSKAVKVLKHFEKPKEEGIYYRLVCITGEDKGKAYLLLGKRVVLGRSDKADIRVLDIKSSREHAEITKVGKDYIVTDLGSQNGVVVNDLKIRQHTLNKEDKVIIGKTVYKFDFIEVMPKKDKEVVEDYVDEEFSEEEPKNKKLTLMLAVIFFAAILLLMDDDSSTSSEKKAKSKYDLKEISDPFTSVLKRKKREDKNSKVKLNLYFQKGLREFREENYFRAMNEFNHALSWSPNDPLAEFYLRKTKEKLDKTIERYFITAKRNEEALKIQKAGVSYCSIVRLLYQYPDDERYKNAKENIKKIEEKLGLDEGEMECFTKLDEK